MIIGTAMMIRDSGQLMGLSCTKGRGITMAGGKVEEGETFREAAIRECLEELGLKIFRAKLVFHGFSTYQGKSYCYCYEAEAWNSRQLSEMLGKNHGSGGKWLCGPVVTF